MGFLRKVHEVVLPDKISNCEIRRTLNIEALLQIERSQLRWFGYVTAQERYGRRVLLATRTGKQLKIRPALSAYISDLGPSHRGVEPAELSGC